MIGPLGQDEARTPVGHGGVDVGADLRVAAFVLDESGEHGLDVGGVVLVDLGPDFSVEVFSHRIAHTSARAPNSEASSASFASFDEVPSTAADSATSGTSIGDQATM
ncbi:MAG: hypothetical protein ACR2KK_05770 [Acidimicrobiales bacterium]